MVTGGLGQLPTLASVKLFFIRQIGSKCTVPFFLGTTMFKCVQYPCSPEYNSYTHFGKSTGTFIVNPVLAYGFATENVLVAV